MYKYYNPNPLGRRTVGDCAVRAVAKAIGVSWDEAHEMLSDMSKNMGTVMNDNDVISGFFGCMDFINKASLGLAEIVIRLESLQGTILSEHMWSEREVMS